MALKDCTFFVDVNGKQVEMDYDQFRAYLLDGTNLSALAPTLVTKKGTKVGFERAEAAPARAEASTAKGEAKAQKGEAKAQKGEAAPEKGEAPTKKKEEKAAPEAKELPPNAPRPVTVENLRLTMGLNKSQAEAVMAVYKAMGLPLPMFRIAKGVFSKPELQAQYEAELEKSGTLARGFIEFFGEDGAKLDGVWAIIRGFGAANVTTPIHEGAHFYRRFMLNTENGFTAQEIKAAEDWAGARNGNWSVAAEEKWARGFERYLRSGEAPLPSLTKLFEKLAKWFQGIYETVAGSAIDVKITPEVKRVFDRIFELQAEKVQAGGQAAPAAETQSLQQADTKARDAEYMAAVKAGDTAKAQKMVEEAAKAAGYTTGPVYHGTKQRFSVFKSERDRTGLIYFSESEKFAEQYARGTGKKRAASPEVQVRITSARRQSDELVSQLLTDAEKRFGGFSQIPLSVQEDAIAKGRDLERGLLDGMTASEAETRMGVRVVRAYLKASSIFDPRQQWREYLPLIARSVNKSPTALDAQFLAHVKAGHYLVWEHPDVIDAILRDYDAVRLQETEGEAASTLAVRNPSQIKSADPITYDDKGNVIPLSERFKPESPDIRYQKEEKGSSKPVKGPVWRSNIIEALKSWPQSKGTPAQFMAHLKKVKGAEAEAKWTGLSDFLEGKSTVTRADIEEFASRNAFIVGETQLEGDATRHGRFRTRGGTDYREIILTSPQLNFKTAHFRGIQGYVAHMRVATFRDSSGRKVLLVDEVQSDLHQRGRKEGYRSSEETHLLKNLDQILEQAHERVRQLNKKKNQLLDDLMNNLTDAGRFELTHAAWDVERDASPELVADLYPHLFRSAESKGLLDNLKEVMLVVSRFGLAKQERDTIIAESQAARKKVPPAPNPDSNEWAIMVFKRAIRLAVEEGADVVAWTPGGTQNARWLGSGKDLRPFYDTILPAALKKFVKPWGGRLGTTELFFKDVTSRQPLTEEEIASWRVVLDRTENKIKLRESAKEQYAADLKRTKEKGLPTLDIERELNTVSSLLATAIADRQSILTLLKQNEGPITAAGTFPAIELTPQMKAEAQKGFTLFQAEGSGADSTAKARAEAIRQNRERMQARREQAGGDTSKQQKGGGTTQQQKGGSSAPRQGRTRSKPQTLSDMLRIAEEQVQAAAEREPQTDTEKRQAQAQRAVMALLRDYVRLKAQGNLPDTYTKADGTQVNREAELFDALTAMLDSATDPDDDARKAMRKALSARFDEILPGRVKSKAGQPKTLQDMLREAERNIRGAAGKKVLSPEETAQQRADQEIKYFIRDYAQKIYTGRLTDDLKLPDGTTVNREREVLDALDALRDALKIPKEGLRLKARAEALRRVEFALFAPPLETVTRPLDVRNFLTGHAWGTASVRSPLSYLNYIGSYERIAGTTGRQVSDTFNEVRTRLARGQYRNFNSALADLRILLRPLKEQLREEGYRGLPSVINEHVRRIERSARSLGKLTWDNVRKAWMEGEFDFGAHLASSIIKAYVFNALLRFNPRAVTLNYAQSLFSLFPFFTPEEFMQLYKDSITPETQARVRDIAIKESGGRFTPEIAEDAKSKLPNPFMSASEQVRIMGHLAGEMMADRLNLPEGIERDMYIRSWAEKAEFDNSAWNAAPLFTGPLMSVLAQFKPYMFKNLERVFTDFFSKPIPGERVKGRQVPGAPAGVQEPVPQLITARQAKMLVVQLGIGGPASLLTLAPGLRMLIGPIMLGLLAKSFSEAAGDDELGEKLAEIVYFGVPAAFALDLSSSVSFIEGPSGKGLAEKIANSLGPAVSLTYRAYTEGDKIYELATRPQKVGESEAVKKELKERTWKLGKALTPYTRMVEAGYSLATGTRPEMFLDKETPLTTGETIGRLIGGSPVRQASYYEMKEAPDLAKRIVGMQPDIAGIPRERGETDKTYRVKVQRVTEWRDSYGKQLENHPRFKTLDKATKDKALEIINGNISAEAAKVKPNLSNLRPAYVIRRAKASIRQAPRRARRQMYVPPPED